MQYLMDIYTFRMVVFISYILPGSKVKEWD